MAFPLDTAGVEFSVSDLLGQVTNLTVCRQQLLTGLKVSSDFP